MKYKKLVVLICLGSHLLVTSPLVFAKKKNPFSKITKAFKKGFEDAANAVTSSGSEVAKGVTSGVNVVAGAGGAAVNQAGNDLSGIARDVAGASGGAVQNVNNFRPQNYLRPSALLDALSPQIDFLKGTALSLNSEMDQVRLEAGKLIQRVTGLTDLEIIKELKDIIRILKASDNLDLLDIAHPDWTSRIEARLSPTLVGTDMTLMQALREYQSALATAMKEPNAIIWELADSVQGIADDVQGLMKPYLASLQSGGSGGAGASDSAPAAPMVAPAAPMVASSLASEGNAEDDDIFDSLCGATPIPLTIGGVLIFVPIERKVIAECGGDAAVMAGKSFISSSDVAAFSELSEKDEASPAADLARHTSSKTYFKQPYGAAWDFRFVVAVSTPKGGLSFTPHIKFPLAWSTPKPSNRTISKSGGNTIIKNAVHNKFIFSPEFEGALLISPITNPLLATIPINVEFPIVGKQMGDGPHGTLLQQIKFTVGLDIGVRWGKLTAPQVRENFEAIARFLRLMREDRRALNILERALSIYSAGAESTAAISTVSPAVLTSAEQVIQNGLMAIGMLAGLTPLVQLIPQVDDQGDVIAATVALPLMMTAFTTALRSFRIFPPGLKQRVSDISLVKLQMTFGYLNANLAAAIAQKQMPAANAGFELVRPGVPDYVGIGMVALPQVTQTLYLLTSPQAVATGNLAAFQVWGPYAYWTPTMVWAGTLAGKLFLDNGSDQYEPMGVR